MFSSFHSTLSLIFSVEKNLKIWVDRLVSSAFAKLHRGSVIGWVYVVNASGWV
ncbi:MAG: hypothetical protein HOB52_07725 [Euryarchaeota archaeon]|nr:hypothetical protein [Euryarchaeota archaeon]